jgi:hypothetical protein
VLKVTANAVRLLPVLFQTGVRALGDLVPEFRNRYVATPEKQGK